MGLATRDVRTEFADLICADAQWLREEFDALISASFCGPPAPPPAPPGTFPRREPCYPPSAPRVCRLPAGGIVRRIEHGHRRQRSPPA